MNPHQIALMLVILDVKLALASMALDYWLAREPGSISICDGIVDFR